jgi:uroporphyrinogen decarboxylase
MNVNLFNMGFDISLNELKDLTGNQVTLLGNIPPRDVLAALDPASVSQKTRELLNSLKDSSRVILSCGGGMAPGVSSENIRALRDAVFMGEVVEGKA